MFNNQIIAGSSGQGGSFYSTTIDQSLRVDDTASQRMYHNTVAGDAQKFTMSCWIKRTELSDAGTIMSSWNGASNFVNMYFTSDYLYCYICDNRSGFVDYNFGTALSGQVFRDVSAWMHIVMAVDTTQASITNRAKIWINGVSVDASSNGSGNDIPQNYNMEINEAGGQTFLFHNPDSSIYYGSFYIADLVYVDGTQYDADTFGEFNNGIWVPLDISAQSITYGNNGFYLDFADSSDLGKDVSGEGNHFTPGTRSAVVSNFSAHDQVLDSPTNNWATNNGAMRANITQSEGNLKMVGVGTNFDNMASTFMFDVEDADGWYWEYRSIGNDSSTTIGISTPQNPQFNQSDPTYAFSNTTACVGYQGSGVKQIAGSNSSYGDSWTAGDIIGVAVKAGEVYFYKNGTIQNSGTAAATGLTGDYVAAYAINGTQSGTANYGQDSTFAGLETAGGNSDANGYGDFKYSVPSGYKALCSANLPEVTIGPNSDTTSDQHFNTVLWTGNGSTQSITGVGFQPDFIWAKERSSTSGHTLLDVVRGVNLGLESNSTAAENDYPTDAQTSFDTDGFSLGSNGRINESSQTYVGWNWKAGGTAVSNTDGSTTSNVSADPDAGFSIVTWLANAATGTVGHGLSSAPELVIAKPRDDSGTNWYVMHTGALTASQVLNLDGTTAAFTPGVAHFNSTYPTSSVISYGGYLGNALTNNNKLAYCFHSVEGYSRVTSYVGNGSSDGTFCFLGHRPAWIMIKNASASSAWYIFDVARNTYNAMDNYLRPNLSNAEGNLDFCDFTSNGFKIRSSAAEWNGSGNTIIVLSFAEQPFKYSNAR